MLKDLFRVFFPDTCIGCHKNLLKSEPFLCINCRHELPKMELKNTQKNIVKSSFFGRINIEHAISFLSFKKKNITQKLIHELKYKNKPTIGKFLGEVFSHEIKDNHLLSDIDYVICVPLHKNKLKIRGYNQVTLFAEELAKTLNRELVENILIRVSNSETQTKKSRFERFLNSHTKFHLTDDIYFENKHVLLVDDVITTGATLEACCKELLKTKKIRISIATIAYTEKD